MRTIKASEVRKGMRVRVEEFLGSRTTQVTEGPVMVSANPYHAEYVELELDGATIGIAGDHPVTVLAEPEPEWVEGAWYWVVTYGTKSPMLRVKDGWSRRVDAGAPHYCDDESVELTVLGRVLIVDWLGDDVARAVLEMFPHVGKNDWRSEDNITCQAVADAIRTQGGAP